ncbi:MAG: DUF4337 domain-containing protein [Rhodomicrobium sp.]
MKKHSQRKPKVPQRSAATPAARRADTSMQRAAALPASEHEKEERKVGVVSGTPADAFDENAERKRDKWVAIYISVLAVLLAFAATGSNDAMKTAQQAGFQVNDQFAFYQAKTIRQSQIKLASDQLELKMLETPNLPEPVLKHLQTSKADYDKEIARLETNARNGKKELLAKAENCENDRNLALAQHPFYDYSMAMLQIAIVLASAAIITGARLLLGASGFVGLFGILLFLNGYTLVYGEPPLKHDKADALEKAGVHISLRCIVE